MDKINKKCLATLKNGNPCPYKGRPEYRGYCGIHKLPSPMGSSLSGEARDKRVSRLLIVGQALIDITLRAVEYLPNLIEIMIDASQIAFLNDRTDQVQWQLPADYPQKSEYPDYKVNKGRLSYQVESALTTFSISPKALPREMRNKLARKDWQDLANMLAYDFDLQINCGNIPERLKAKIFLRKKGLVAALGRFGYKPKIPAARRPVFSRILDN